MDTPTWVALASSADVGTHGSAQGHAGRQRRAQILVRRSSREFQTIHEEIIADPENIWAKDLGYLPLYAAAPGARIAVIGQAPGRKAQESGIAWNDASGIKLFDWLGVSETQFRDPDLFALLPMDFYYPGKGAAATCRPEKSSPLAGTRRFSI